MTEFEFRLHDDRHPRAGRRARLPRRRGRAGGRSGGGPQRDGAPGRRRTPRPCTTASRPSASSGSATRRQAGRTPGHSDPGRRPIAGSRSCPTWTSSAARTASRATLRRYWKGHYFRELPDAALEALLGHDPSVPGRASRRTAAPSPTYPTSDRVQPARRPPSSTSSPPAGPTRPRTRPDRRGAGERGRARALRQRRLRQRARRRRRRRRTARVPAREAGPARPRSRTPTTRTTSST